MNDAIENLQQVIIRCSDLPSDRVTAIEVGVLRQAHEEMLHLSAELRQARQAQYDLEQEVEDLQVELGAAYDEVYERSVA